MVIDSHGDIELSSSCRETIMWVNAEYGERKALPHKGCLDSDLEGTFLPALLEGNLQTELIVYHHLLEYG